MKASVLITLLAMTALAKSVTVGPREFPRATAGESYEAKLTPVLAGRCPAGEVTWTLAGGALPDGLALDATGLRGVPARTGTYEFILRESTACGGIDLPARVTVGGRPVLAVSAEELEFEIEVGGKAEARTFLVSSDRAHLAYSISAAGAAWLQFAPGSGNTLEPGSGDPVSVRVDAAALSVGNYEAVLRITAWRGANVPSVRVRLRVLPRHAE